MPLFAGVPRCRGVMSTTEISGNFEATSLETLELTPCIIMAISRCFWHRQ